ncbi:MAG: SpoIIE family protein phosphatase [Bacteroidia bacterium]|nr:SpoIIE family protein phosphatase [Bacteroidia bacterium]
MAINSLIAVHGQSTDSLLYLLNNGLVKDDVDKYDLLCKIASNSTDADSKLQYSEQAIKLAEKLNLIPAQPTVFKGIGYLNSGNLASALECFMKAANYYKADNNNNGLANAYLYIAETYNLQENHNNEKYYLKNAIEIYRKEKDSINLALALHNLGYANYGMGQYDTALILFSTTSEIFQKLGYLTQYAYCLGNSGLAYSRLSDFDKAEDYLLRAIEILTKQGDERAVTEYMIEYAGILQHKGEIKKAIACATLGFGSAIKNGFKEYERNAAYRLARLYQVSGKYDSAYHFQSLYINANDSIKSDENIQKMADLRTEFEVAKKQAEVEVLQKKKLIQRIVILGLAIILLLAMGLIMLYNYSLKRSKMLTAALDERRILLEKQSIELLEQNDKIIKANEELKQLYEITNSQKEEIISSIKYAQRIQTAILPPETYITELINENFIFYKPKEIVSGDFYWIKQVKHYIILVCADCTGHGVPGAFMSMLGISYLNEIVQRREITQANQILNELRKQIKHSLRQSGEKDESRDGIDIALCVIDSKKNIIQYSGAYNPLYIINNINGEAVLKEIKGDSMPVGVHFSSDKPFTNHEIKLEIGDTIYIFSDGFVDQIGGNDNTKFRSMNFKKLLLDIYERPMYEQKEILEQTLKDWMGMQPQRDDILIIGARVF